jgi:tRNA(fMet)-specific endonuclease VapC
MSRYLLDTGIASDYINRRNGVFERASAEVARGHQIGISTPVLGELCYGVEASATRERNLRLLSRAMLTWTLWPFDHVAAEEYGRIAATLRRIGRPMQSIDIQSAAIARCLGNCTVVSKDSDLSAVPGLSVENWATG